MATLVMMRTLSKILVFIELLITEKNFQLLKTRPKIQLNLLKGLKRITMEKMICLSCLLLKTEKKLTSIAFLMIKKRPSILKRSFNVLFQSKKTSFPRKATPISKYFIEDAEKTLGKKLYFELQIIKPDNYCYVKKKLYFELQIIKPDNYCYVRLYSFLIF